ncbi:MAG: SEC-C metal-binding domain-containing protein [Fidelibacterota bacterium]
MNHKQFWKQYLKQNPINIYDNAIQFFSQEIITDDIMQKYDYVDVMIEFQSALEDAKEYEKLIKFVDIIQNYQPVIYQESFGYLNIPLLTYYLFKEEPEKAKASFQPFIQNPVEAYDLYLNLLKTFLFFQQEDIINEAITKNLNEIRDSKKLVFGSNEDLVGFLFYRELEKYYANSQFNRDELIKLMNHLEYEVSEKMLKRLEFFYKGSYDKEKIKNIGNSQNINDRLLLKCFFLEYMKNKGFSFPYTGFLWDSLMDYFYLNNQTKTVQNKTFFNITYQSFNSYLRNNVDIWLRTTNQCFNLIWGAVYFYDFLNSYEIIGDQEYQIAISVINKVKEKYKSNNEPDLWEYTFIHSWEKPDSISEQEFLEEEKTFRDTFSIVEQNTPGNYLPDNLDEDWEENLDDNLDDDFDNGKIEIPGEKHNFIHNEGRPIKVEKAPGRNDPCPCGSGKKYIKCCGK